MCINKFSFRPRNYGLFALGRGYSIKINFLYL